jgi:MYXO-CTERM domain-containing protein
VIHAPNATDSENFRVMNLNKLTTLAALMMPTLVACGAADSGADARDDEARLGRQASAIQDGESDTRGTHNYAVGIASRYGAVCSGTLIAPNLVLTARHCVVPPDGQSTVTCKDKFPTQNAPASSLFVSPDPNLRGTKKFYAAKTITTPTETAFCGNDIALIELADNIPASEAHPATPVVQFSMTDRTKIGSQIAAMGYGITSPSAEDSGTRRVREEIDILCVPGDSSHPCTDKVANLLGGNEKEFVTAGYVCSGDSGGGAFDQSSFTKGTPYVLGALSRGPESKEKCLSAVYSRTDAHADMIRAAAEIALEHGGYERPDWLTVATWSAPVPGCVGEICTSVEETEPDTIIMRRSSGCSASSSTPTSSSFGLLAILSVGLLVARRRR